MRMQVGEPEAPAGDPPAPEIVKEPVSFSSLLLKPLFCWTVPRGNLLKYVVCVQVENASSSAQLSGDGPPPDVDVSGLKLFCC